MRTNNDTPMWLAQENLSSFTNQYTKGNSRPLLFIGSGLSMSAGLPNWEELLENIAIILDKGGDAPGECLSNVKNRLSGDKKFKHQNAGEYLKNITREKREGWHKVVKSALYAGGEVAGESRIHSILSEMNFHRIVTTNYDTLIEQSLKEKGVSINVCSLGSKDLGNMETSSEKYIYKIHGDIGNNSSKIVLAKSEYEDLYGGDNYHIEEILSLQTVLRSATVILFIGYGHNDEFVNNCFQNMMRFRRKRNVFAIIPRNFDDPRAYHQHISKLYNNSGVQFITYSPDKRHEELAMLLAHVGQNKTDNDYLERANIKRPTIVMTYCGGTIGSHRLDTDKLGIDLKKSRFDPSLRQFSDQLLSWYSHDCIPMSKEKGEIDLVWEVMPENLQIFSENSTPDLWNNLCHKVASIVNKYINISKQSVDSLDYHDDDLYDLYLEEKTHFSLENGIGQFSEKRFIQNLKNRYILGIILLTGTDTLPYTASALTLSLCSLPCSIVLTGANQPPDENESNALSRALAKSDSWRNITTALYFLQTIGHKLTEVFVSFGDTIHNGINLRKRSIEAIPFSRDVISNRRYEPFMFRNLTFQNQYMFKLIDGVFCNNYYPSGNLPYAEMIDNPKGFKHRQHIRYYPFEPSSELAWTKFSTCVRTITATPCSPDIDVKSMLNKKGSDKLRAVLLVGYASGTYPTINIHSLTDTLKKLYENNIPIILTSLYGIVPTQQNYETLLIDDVDIPVLRLYGIIEETLLPLLSLIVGNVTDEEWCGATDVNSRCELIRRHINDLFRRRHCLFLENLEDIMKKENLFYKWQQLEQSVTDNDNKRQMMISERKPFSNEKISEASEIIHAWKSRERKRTRNKTNTIFIYRTDFLALLEEFTISPFEKIGLGPEGFKMLNNMGFKLGGAIAAIECEEMKWMLGKGYRPYIDAPEDDKDKVLSLSNEVFQNIVTMLNLTGYSEVSLIKTVENSPYEITVCNGDSLAIGFRIVRRKKTMQSGEKYAAISYSSQDLEFFDKLTNGNFVESEGAYHRLLVKSWELDTRSLDWFIVGILRGITAQLAQKLRINDLAIKSSRIKLEGFNRALSESTRLSVTVGDENEFCGYITFTG